MACSYRTLAHCRRSCRCLPRISRIKTRWSLESSSISTDACRETGKCPARFAIFRERDLPTHGKRRSGSMAYSEAATLRPSSMRVTIPYSSGMAGQARWRSRRLVLYTIQSKWLSSTRPWSPRSARLRGIKRSSARSLAKMRASKALPKRLPLLSEPSSHATPPSISTCWAMPRPWTRLRCAAWRSLRAKAAAFCATTARTSPTTNFTILVCRRSGR